LLTDDAERAARTLRPYAFVSPGLVELGGTNWGSAAASWCATRTVT